MREESAFGGESSGASAGLRLRGCGGVLLLSWEVKADARLVLRDTGLRAGAGLRACAVCGGFVWRAQGLGGACAGPARGLRGAYAWPEMPPSTGITAPVR
ncbi:hypothetical protein GCM10018952_53600 [Streptosporangium vulgare]